MLGERNLPNWIVSPHLTSVLTFSFWHFSQVGQTEVNYFKAASNIQVFLIICSLHQSQALQVPWSPFQIDNAFQRTIWKGFLE